MKKIILISNIVFTCLCSLTVKSQIINTIAGTGIAGYSGDGGLAINAQLLGPHSVAVDPQGNIYIADGPTVRKINTSGVISTFAGSGVIGNTGDGGLAINAKMNHSMGFAFDAVGNVYISDAANNNIRKVDTLGIISTFAGTGIAGFNGDGIAASSASLFWPCGISCDSIGNLYIADSDNHRVRKVDTSGIISTIAGTGFTWLSGNGGLAINSTIYTPMDVVLDSHGNIFIAESGFDRIRKIDAFSGIISTYAGSAGNTGYNGDGGLAISAYLNYPYGIAIDSSDNLYIADTRNERVRKVDPTGIISTIAGTGVPGFSGDGGISSNAQIYFNYDSEVGVDRLGNIYISDYGNLRIRKISISSITTINELTNSSILIYPNPTNGIVNIANIKNNTAITVFNYCGQKVIEKNISAISDTIDLSDFEKGIYLINVNNKEKTLTKKIIIE